ncbi:MAG: hypothetical protein ACREU7_02915 [Burkholderiales bacterium]
MSWRVRLREVAEQDWQPAGFAGLGAFVVLFLPIAWLAHSGERWVPLLDSANLVFHEAGHPLLGLLSDRLTVYGGTLGQLALPLAVAATFWWRRLAVSFAFALGWIAENLWNIARYMADARARVLPLVGSGEHDWTEIFLRWGALDADLTVAGATRLAGWVLLLAAAAWLTRRAFTEAG